MGTVRSKDVHSHGSNVFRQGHYKLLPDRVYRRVGHLSELLPEVVEQQLGPVGQNSKLGVITHRGYWFLGVGAHRKDNFLDVLPGEVKAAQLARIVFHFVVSLAPAAELCQLRPALGKPFPVVLPF